MVSDSSEAGFRDAHRWDRWNALMAFSGAEKTGIFKSLFRYDFALEPQLQTIHDNIFPQISDIRRNADDSDIFGIKKIKAVHRFRLLNHVLLLSFLASSFHPFFFFPFCWR